MNILFYLLFHPATGMGGIERITGRLCDAFAKRGHRVFCVHGLEADNKSCDRKYPFEKNLCISNIRRSAQEMSQFLEENKIDVIINQSFFCSGVTEELLRIKDFSDIKFDCHYLRQIVDSISHPCKLITVLHNVPGSEYSGRTWRRHVFPIITGAKNLSGLIWGVKNIWGAAKVQLYFKHLVDCYCRDLQSCSDKFILLSPAYKTDWQKIVKDKSQDNVSAIPNMLSYAEWLEESEVAHKEKTVLIVARLDEHQKRLSRALRIWKNIEQAAELNDWKMIIVGTGESETLYKDYAAKNLKRVSFAGWQEPKEYYKEASVFIMTSAYEGWPLTLAEAQQFGCVPVVLNTFESVGDVITDGENGYLAENEKEFCKKLSHLMKSSEQRQSMAKNAIESSRRFSEDAVCESWLEMLSNI